MSAARRSTGFRIEAARYHKGMSNGFSPESLCPHRDYIVASSVDIGWKSLLLEQTRLPHSVEYDTRLTPDPHLFVLTRGTLKLTTRFAGSSQRWAYDAGTAGILPGGNVARLALDLGRSEASVDISQLFVPPRFFEEAAEHYRAAGQHVSAVPDPALGFRDPMVVEAVLSLIRAMANGAPDLYAETFALSIATHLLAPWRAQVSTERNVGAITDPRLGRVLEYMAVHFAEPLDLARLAREAGVSKFHFARLFRERTGTTPHRHLVDVRLRAAERMLTGTARNVAEIAAACGYENAAHFGAAFGARYGMSPGVFRSCAKTSKSC